MNVKLFLGVTLVTLSLPLAAHAQNGAAGGATTGAVTGAVVGGPVGAAVGAGVGAVAGGIADESRPRFRGYVSERHIPSYRYEHEVRVGEDLPEAGFVAAPQRAIRQEAYLPVMIVVEVLQAIR